MVVGWARERGKDEKPAAKERKIAKKKRLQPNDSAIYIIAYTLYSTLFLYMRFFFCIFVYAERLTLHS